MSNTNAPISQCVLCGNWGKVHAECSQCKQPVCSESHYMMHTEGQHGAAESSTPEQQMLAAIFGESYDGAGYRLTRG